MNSSLRKLLPGLAATFILLATFATPALAHKGEAHEETAAAAAPAATEAQTPAADESIPPVTDMAWPTEEPGGGMMMSHKEKPKTFTGRLIAWLGAWHPGVIHFPIALTLVVAFLELAAGIRRKPIYNAGNKLLLGLATLGAFVAAPLGWMDAGWPSATDEPALIFHRWIGTSLPLLLLVLWWAKRPAEAAAVRPSGKLYEGLLTVVVVVILVQAYLGGEVTHGAGHLAF